MSEAETDLGLPLSLLGALGLFVAAYGNLEHTMHQIAYRYLELDEEASRAVFAGMRLADVMSATKRLVLAHKLDQQIYDDLDQLFREVTALSLFRDKIVHRQWDKGPGGTVLANLVSAKSGTSIEETAVKTQDLTAKIEECGTLHTRLLSHLVTQELWLKLDSLQLDPEARALLRCPWFDKPGPPATPPQLNLKNRGTRSTPQ